jgi:uncharacterized protein
MNLISIIPLLSVLNGSPASTRSIHPSFDCAKADLPDEKSICRYNKLAQFDEAIAIAAKKVGGEQIKHPPDDTTDYPTERRNCGGNAACIPDVQAQEISTLDGYGARIPVPQCIGSYRLFLLRESGQHLVDTLPMSIGACTKTKIVGMTNDQVIHGSGRWMTSSIK